MGKRTTKQAAKAASASSAGSKRKSRTEVSPARPSSSAAASAAPPLSDGDEEKQAAASASVASAPSAASATSSSSSSASASTASAPNPLLASVLESASSAAPVAKRTRRAQQAAQVAEARVLVSPMLRLLGRDSGARQSLMQMLPVRDLASLVSSCGSWRAWIAEEPASVGSQRIAIRRRSLVSFLSCGWIQRAVQTFFFSDPKASAAAHDQFAHCLPRTRLRSLEWLCCDKAIDQRLLRDGLSAVAATLTELRVAPFTWMPHALTLTLWSAISEMTGLVSLNVTLSRNSAVDLSFLPLRRLERLRINIGADQVFTPEQVDALAQCTALTDLRCGHWLPAEWLMDHQEPIYLTHQALIQSRFALLIQRRAENGAAPLRRLSLGKRAVIDPIGWQTLSQCTDLESIEASWSSALTEADWARLSSFQHLRSLEIESVLTFNFRQAVVPLELDRILPPLVRCRALRSLILLSPAGSFSLRIEHAALIARIPSLETLKCERLCIESLAPLTAAPALTEVQVYECTRINGEPINVDELVPSMPHGCRLKIIDRPHRCLSFGRC